MKFNALSQGIEARIKVMVKQEKILYRRLKVYFISAVLELPKKFKVNWAYYFGNNEITIFI